MKPTVNELLSLTKAVRSRRHELVQLRSATASEETRSLFGREQEIVKEKKVHYDMKELDKKVVELDNFLFKADAAIKQSNAMTKIDMDVDVDSLLQPLL